MTQSFIKDQSQSVQHDALSYTLKNTEAPKRVGILGGGTAGATIAIRLAALGLETYLF